MKYVLVSGGKSGTITLLASLSWVWLTVLRCDQVMLSFQLQWVSQKLIMHSGIGKGVIGKRQKVVCRGICDQLTRLKASSCGLLLKTRGFKVDHTLRHANLVL